MAKSRGTLIAEQQKRSGGVVVVAEDQITKDSLIKRLAVLGIKATTKDSLAVLKKKLATSEGE